MLCVSSLFECVTLCHIPFKEPLVETVVNIKTHALNAQAILCHNINDVEKEIVFQHCNSAPIQMCINMPMQTVWCCVMYEKRGVKLRQFLKGRTNHFLIRFLFETCHLNRSGRSYRHHLGVTWQFLKCWLTGRPTQTK